MGQNLAALRAGRLAVIQVFESFVSMALDAGAHILYAASARGPTVYTSFIGTRAGTVRLSRARCAPFDARRNGSPRTRPPSWAAAVASYYPDVPPEILTRSLRRYADAGIWAREPAMSREGFSRLAESLVSGKFLSRLPRYEDCVEESLK